MKAVLRLKIGDFAKKSQTLRINAVKDLGRLGRATVLLFRRHPPDSSALRLPLNRPCRLPPAPPSMKMGATFLLRVPLPARFNGKYDPASRPSSTPTLLKPSDRRRFTKPGRTKPESEPRPKPPRKVLPPKVERTPEGQREREGPSITTTDFQM